MAWVGKKNLVIVPLTLRQLNALVEKLHRHHKPVRGHRFSLGVKLGDDLVGACCVGRPVARGCDPYLTAEVTRLVTDGTKNACSSLYSAAARAAKAMGYLKIQTYILDSELGTSLRASGWELEGTVKGRLWNNFGRSDRRTDQPSDDKQRWVKILRRT